MSVDHPVARRLAERTLALVNIAWVSRWEAEIMRHVCAAIPADFTTWFDDGEALVAGTPRHRCSSHR